MKENIDLAIENIKQFDYSQDRIDGLIKKYTGWDLVRQLVAYCDELDDGWMAHTNSLLLDNYGKSNYASEDA